MATWKTRGEFIAGALVRRDFRRALRRVETLGVTWEEDKGFLNSQFIVYAPPTLLDTLKKAFCS